MFVLFGFPGGLCRAWEEWDKMQSPLLPAVELTARGRAPRKKKGSNLGDAACRRESGVGLSLKQSPRLCVPWSSRSRGMLFCLVPREWVGFKLT